MRKLGYFVFSFALGSPAFAQDQRPCRGDAFYIDVPLAQNPQWTDTAFLSAAEAQLKIDANVNDFWFCETGDLACTNREVFALASALLPQRQETFRTDGHLRFFRIHFEDNQRNILVSRTVAACAITARIRELVMLHASVAADSFYAGRECDATSMSAQGAPSQEMLDWHLRRIGVSATALNIVRPDLPAQNVDLALIDSGVINTVTGAIGVFSSADYLSLQPGHHAHGTGMAILSRHVAPSARLHSARALESGGSGTSGTLAKAIDDALYVYSERSRPLVMNLSLGWPSGLDRAAQLSGPSCATWEDPFGEAVRYLLHIARRLDETNERPILVVAAAGNQPYSVAPTFYPPPPAGWTQPACVAQSISGAKWFYPAHWDRLASCRNNGQVARVAFGIGAIDDREQPSGVSIANSEPALVAPGQHVYAHLPGAAQPTEAQTAIQCDSNTAIPPPVTLARAFTGTSVSSILVAAAAARAQAQRVIFGATPFNGETLARLLYLTGKAVCRNTQNGTPVRRLDVARLDRALSRTYCQPLLTCAQSQVSADLIFPSLLDNCRAQLAACGLEQLSGGGSIITTCNLKDDRVPWPKSYTSPICSDTSAQTTFFDAASCGSTCPFADGPYRTLLGSLGPSPDRPACPDCPTIVHAPTGSWKLTVELSNEYAVGTTFTNPYLILEGPDKVTGILRTYAVGLLSVSTASQWKPGAYFRMQGTMDNLPDFKWTQTKAMLSLTIAVPGVLPGKDVSALRLTAVE
jgi:hypothetical protein